MATDPTIDPAQTTSTEPPSSQTTQPSNDATENVEELKAKLAAAESEANTWKGRVEKANEKKKKDTPVTSVDLEELEWKLANKDRIGLVKDEYDKLLIDGYHGEKVSEKVALALAEKEAKIDNSNTKRARQNDMDTPSVTNRNVNPKGYADETDEMLGLTIEKKKKLDELHPHLRQV